MASRPQRSGSNPVRPQSVLYRLTPVVRTLFLVDCALFLLYLFVKPVVEPMREHAALNTRFFAGELWLPVTSLFVHTPLVMQGALGFVFNMVGLWFFGPVIESSVGKLRFLLVFLGSGVVANLAMSITPGFAAGVPWDGCSYSVLALVVAFGRIFDRTQTPVFGALVIRARTLAIFFFAWSLLASLIYMSWPGVTGTIVASAVAYALSGADLVGWWYRWRRARLRRRYQVLDGGRTESKNLPN